MLCSDLDVLDVHLLFCFAVFVSYQKNFFFEFGFVKQVLAFCSILDYVSLIFLVRGMYFLWVIIFRLLDLGARYVHFCSTVRDIQACAFGFYFIFLFVFDQI